MMKFLLVVLAIRFLAEMISNKKDAIHANDAEVMNGKILHPAEFALR